MAAKLDNLGYARVFRHARTGELVVDTDSLRRPGGAFSGADFGADRYDDEDEYDDEDDLYDDEDEEYDDDDFEGDDFGEDVEGDEELGEDVEGEELEGDDFGARGRRRRRRLKRRLGRLNRREARVRRKLRQTRRRRKGRKATMWGMTAVAGTSTLAAAGGASVKMRLQHDFHAEDITFTGSAAGAKVTSIFFGDRVVWSSSDGIDVAVFGSTSFLRGLLKGQSLKGGLDITVNGTLTGPGDFAVTLVGKKPVTSRC
jgi:hypothetical protein